MKTRLLVIGLDCLGSEVLEPQSLAELPHLRSLVEQGISGPLESTLPPITVPAWSAMLSGRDPGELGIYGFRNRRSFDYGDLVYASSASVRWPRLWDHVGAGGGRSIVVGVPQTAPPPAIEGELVAGFEAAGFGPRYTHPPELAEEIAELVGEYLFDAEDFRNTPRQEVLDRVYAMTEQRCRLMEHLLTSRRWDFAMLCEIGPDRLHHCFWSDHDPAHPRHDPESPYRDAIRGYYRFLDGKLGRLLEVAGSDCFVAVVSDHGAKSMQGGVCINEVLSKSGWLTLKEAPEEPVQLAPDHVDWSRTRAWGAGGYYARIFLNVEGREPQGVIPRDQRDEARRELTRLLEKLELPHGPTLTNEVIWPERTYRRVRGLAPDLLVFFADLGWRSLGSIGHGRLWLRGNDTGVDEANHARDGLFVLAGGGLRHRDGQRASILDIAPTLLRRMGLPVPADLAGSDLLADDTA